jgi:hypothetical protein
MQLLFVAAHWHGLAKLRMHINSTIKLLETVTTSFGDKLRAFSKKTCLAFNTRELQRELDARARREARESAARTRANRQESAAHTRANRQAGTSLVNHMPLSSQPHSGPIQGLSTHTSASENPVNAPQISGTSTDQAGSTANSRLRNNKRRQKSFSLNTYKVHALGDYATTIRRYGTTDSYSTEPVCNTHHHFLRGCPHCSVKGELEHRSPKARYTRTSRKHFIKQLTQIERRQARIRRIHEQHHKCGKPQNEQVQVASTPDVHHVIGKSQNHPKHITLFLRKHAGDPAVKV